METVLKVAGGIRDQIRQDLFDTIILPANESPIGERRFFSNAQNKARYLTNLRLNGALEGQVSYRIQGIVIDAYSVQEDNIDVLPLVTEHSYCTLRVGEKNYLEIPFRTLTGGLSVFSGGAIDSFMSQYGRPSEVGIILKGQDSLDIKPNQTFDVLWTCGGMSSAEVTKATPVADSKISFVCSFKGLMRRPVQ